MWCEQISDFPYLVNDVAMNMREWDRREIYATRYTNDPQALAADAADRAEPFGWVAGVDYAPIAAFGCAEKHPGVYSMWLFATDRFGEIRFSMTRMVRRAIVPMMFDAGAHRLEAYSMDGHTDAQKWMGLTGASREATLAAYGRGGEDFHVYTWKRP